jgi:hypothetical protein
MARPTDLVAHLAERSRYLDDIGAVPLRESVSRHQRALIARGKVNEAQQLGARVFGSPAIGQGVRPHARARRSDRPSARSRRRSGDGPSDDSDGDPEPNLVRTGRAVAPGPWRRWR